MTDPAPSPHDVSHHLVPRNGTQVCVYCKREASSLGIQPTQQSCDQHPEIQALAAYHDILSALPE